jgi:hypothetical protein
MILNNQPGQADVVQRMRKGLGAPGLACASVVLERYHAFLRREH